MVNTAEGEAEAFIVKLNADGDHLWSTSFGGSSWDSCKALTLDSGGSVYAVGNFLGGFIELGDNVVANVGSYDSYLLRLDSNGSHLWSRGFGGGASDYIDAIAVALDDSLVVTGYFQSSTLPVDSETLYNAGGSDVFVVKFDQQ